MPANTEYTQLNNFRTPLLLTDKDGLVIFRNNAFSSHFRKPRRGGNIYRQIGASGSFEDVFPNGLPAYSEIEKLSGTGMNIVRSSWRAFVFHCEDMPSEEAKECLVWLFPRRLITASLGQATALLPFYTERIGTLHSMLMEFYKLQYAKPLRRLPYSRSPESVYDSISEDSAFELRHSGGAHEFPVDLATFFMLFIECAKKQLGIRGFRFEYSLSNIKIGDTLTIAGYELTKLCVQLIYASLIISDSHKLILDCSYEDSRLNINLTAPLSEGTCKSKATGSIYGAAFNNLSLSAELFFCDLLWNTPGRRVIWESLPEKVVLRAECVLESPYYVRLRNADTLAMADLSNKITELFNIFDV
jgi:hypothetical protein